MQFENVNDLASELFAEVETKGEVIGVVLVVLGRDAKGVTLSQVGATMADEAMLPFAYAQASTLTAAASLPPEAVPGFAAEEA